ncbi:MAG: NAD(+) diphosphatase [Synergistaceae bacterium]|nr:NAD(+) diphosphatase [Synergistaceae bacterium]
MMIFCGNKILLRGNKYDFADGEISGPDVISCSRDLPGAWQNLPAWLDVKESGTLGDGVRLVGLRDFWHIAGDKAFSEASSALQFCVWFRNARYCSRCGGEIVPHSHDFGRECEACGAVYYAPISPAVITAVEHEGRLLLAHNSAWTNDRYSVIAGFVEPGERLEEAVRREIMEEVGVTVRGIKYFGSQTWPFPNSLMVGFTAEYEAGEIVPDGAEILKAGFFDPEEIVRMNIPDKASIARKLIDNFLASHSVNTL